MNKRRIAIRAFTSPAHFFAACSLGFAVVGACAAQAEPSQDEIYAAARDAWLYAYPIVTMDVMMRQAVNVPDTETANMRAPFNQFAHARAYPVAEERDVVRYNFDTLYSLAWLDLTDGPVVLSVPDMGDHYYLLPLVDMWTDIFAVVGTRTTGQGAGDYAIVAPGWTGELPQGVERIEAPTPFIWVVGRTKTDGPADYTAVHAIQDGYRLTPLSAWGRTYTAPSRLAVDAAIDETTPPQKQVHAMTGVEMLTRLGEVMQVNPPHANDQPLLARLKAIGFEPGAPFDAASLDPGTVGIINRAAADQLSALPAAVTGAGQVMGSWRVSLHGIGTYGAAYRQRMIVAAGGIGALWPEDAIYPVAFVDADGQTLNGAHRYKLHFPAGQLPPADAFWSVTMYDATGFHIPNPINRFAISSHDALQYNDDGSLDILIQTDSPGRRFPADAAAVFPARRGARRRLDAPCIRQTRLTEAGQADLINRRPRCIPSDAI